MSSTDRSCYSNVKLLQETSERGS